jgi:predicted  nucleic acid-binding Zn-ribbon protein
MKINKEQTDILVELQSTDTECTRIKSFLVDLPRKIEALDADLEVYENELSDKENAFSEKKKEYREDESDIQMNLSKIKERDVKLLSVRENKTYQILLREIDELKKKNSATEDKMLENLEYTEEEEVLLTQKKAEFEQAKNEIEKEKEEIGIEKEQEEKKISELEEQWNKNSQKLKPELLKSYLDVRQRTGSVAVAAAKNSVCSGCNMNIPPQMFNELQKCDTLQLCPHCHRIIYWANGD